MIKFWINPLTNNNYSEGDQPSPQHIEVAQRPDWTYNWNGAAWVQDATKLATSQQPAKDAADLAIIKADNVVITFLSLNPAAASAWIDTNVTNLPSAIVAIKILAKAVLVLARQSLR